MKFDNSLANGYTRENYRTGFTDRRSAGIATTNKNTPKTALRPDHFAFVVIIIVFLKYILRKICLELNKGK